MVNRLVNHVLPEVNFSLEIRLSAEDREVLLDALPAIIEGVLDDPHWVNDPEDKDWRKVEQALTKILTKDAPQRYVQRYVAGVRPDTQANEIHGLTPKPLEERVPGAWNFVEPAPWVTAGNSDYREHPRLPGR